MLQLTLHPYEKYHIPSNRASITSLLRLFHSTMSFTLNFPKSQPTVLIAQSHCNSIPTDHREQSSPCVCKVATILINSARTELRVSKAENMSCYTLLQLAALTNWSIYRLLLCTNGAQKEACHIHSVVDYTCSFSWQCPSIFWDYIRLYGLKAPCISVRACESKCNRGSFQSIFLPILSSSIKLNFKLSSTSSARYHSCPRTASAKAEVLQKEDVQISSAFKHSVL